MCKYAGSTHIRLKITEKCVKQVVSHIILRDSGSGMGGYLGMGRELQLLPEGEVAGVAEAGDDVGVAGEFFVDGGDPEGDFVA